MCTNYASPSMTLTNKNVILRGPPCVLKNNLIIRSTIKLHKHAFFKVLMMMTVSPLWARPPWYPDTWHPHKAWLVSASRSPHSHILQSIKHSSELLSNFSSEMKVRFPFTSKVPDLVFIMCDTNDTWCVVLFQQLFNVLFKGLLHNLQYILGISEMSDSYFS